MKFALLNAVRNHPATPAQLADLYADYISDAVLAEELGFARSVYGEHHFRECQWTGSPILVATAVAARTERIRVGTAVALLPFHDPRRLAEDVAIADIISNGRFDFGIGPGSQFEEFRSFGIVPAEMNGRMWESIDWIMRAFAEPGEFSHHGRYYDIPDMTFTTKPVQSPVPVYSSAMGPRNQARAAERGFHFIGPVGSGYEQAITAAGRDVLQTEISIMVPICLADSTDRAWEISGAGLEYFVNFYALRRDLQGNPSQSPAITSAMLRSGNAGFWSVAVGTPEDVVALLRPVVDGSLGHVTELGLQFRQPGMSTADTHRSMRLFAEHCVPALAEAAAH